MSPDTSVFLIWSLYFLTFGLVRAGSLWLHKKFTGREGFFREVLAHFGNRMPFVCSLLMFSMPLLVTILMAAQGHGRIVASVISLFFSLVAAPTAWKDAKRSLRETIG